MRETSKPEIWIHCVGTVTQVRTVAMGVKGSDDERDMEESILGTQILWLDPQEKTNRILQAKVALNGQQTSCCLQKD